MDHGASLLDQPSSVRKWYSRCATGSWMDLACRNVSKCGIKYSRYHTTGRGSTLAIRYSTSVGSSSRVYPCEAAFYEDDECCDEWPAWMGRDTTRDHGNSGWDGSGDYHLCGDHFSITEPTNGNSGIGSSRYTADLNFVATSSVLPLPENT